MSESSAELQFLFQKLSSKLVLCNVCTLIDRRVIVTTGGSPRREEQNRMMMSIVTSQMEKQGTTGAGLVGVREECVIS